MIWIYLGLVLAGFCFIEALCCAAHRADEEIARLEAEAEKRPDPRVQALTPALSHPMGEGEKENNL